MPLRSLLNGYIGRPGSAYEVVLQGRHRVQGVGELVVGEHENDVRLGDGRRGSRLAHGVVGTDVGAEKSIPMANATETNTAPSLPILQTLTVVLAIRADRRSINPHPFEPLVWRKCGGMPIGQTATLG
jgi:hypothetical protein